MDANLERIYSGDLFMQKGQGNPNFLLAYWWAPDRTCQFTQEWLHFHPYFFYSFKLKCYYHSKLCIATILKCTESHISSTACYNLGTKFVIKVFVLLQIKSRKQYCSTLEKGVHHDFHQLKSFLMISRFVKWY